MKVRRAGASGGARRASGQSVLLEHARALRESLNHARANPAATIIGVAVMAIAIGLPAILYVLVQNQQALVAEWSGEPSLSAFLRKDVAGDEIADLRRRLAADVDMSKLEFVSAEQAFAEFAAATGLTGSALDSGNPLPSVLIVTLTHAAWTRDRGGAVVDRLTAERAVDTVIVDFAWVERFAALGTLAERGVSVLAVVLAGGVLLIVGNTIRVLVHQQTDEIEVLKLVGATDAFVRRPFLYSGALHGLAAGILAVGLVEAVFMVLAEPAARVAAAYTGTFTLTGLPWHRALDLLAVSTVLGWCGAWIGIGLSLRRLEPRMG